MPGGFDFTPVKDPGLYVIEYAEQRTAPFPISRDAYANIWQDSLDHHLAEQMDHVSVREGYRVWHGASHLDDGRLAPVVGEQFDGWNQATATDGKYQGGDHIPGMNVGGWYDAGDFDLEEPAQLSVIQSLALAYRQFNLKYDELTADEPGGTRTWATPRRRRTTATPFGVPPSLGTWGGSGAVVDMAIRMYFLHKTFPDLVSPEYTLRARGLAIVAYPSHASPSRTPSFSGRVVLRCKCTGTPRHPHTRRYGTFPNISSLRLESPFGRRHVLSWRPLIGRSIEGSHRFGGNGYHSNSSASFS